MNCLWCGVIGGIVGGLTLIAALVAIVAYYEWRMAGMITYKESERDDET